MSLSVRLLNEASVACCRGAEETAPAVSTSTASATKIASGYPRIMLPGLFTINVPFSAFGLAAREVAIQHEDH